MRNLFARLALAAVLGSLLLTIQPMHAQGTAFTYQGQLFDNGLPANGDYAMYFTLYSSNSTLAVVSVPVTNAPVAVSNGLFTVLLDFGPGAFTGSPRWLQIYAATNSASPAYIPLIPRQLLSPAPYAIFANTASNLSGTLPTAQLSGTVNNGQLAYSGITVSAGAGLGVGGTGALGTTVTLTNTGVLTVTGNADITAAPTSGNVVLGDTATSTNLPNVIIKRDGSGSFGAGSVTLGNNLNLPVTTATAGIIYSGSSTLLHAYGNNNFFGGAGAGNFSVSGGGNTGLGSGAMSGVTSGGDNVAVGTLALNANTTGDFNTGVGVDALKDNTSGFFNTASGVAALFSNTSGSNNTANGSDALYNNLIGNNNTANGSQALYNNTADGNTATGFSALNANTSGNDNTASGYNALLSNTNGSDNTANGAGALGFNTSGSYNTAIGYQALLNNQADNNTACGDFALLASTTGGNNTACGGSALLASTTGSNNTAIGGYALYRNTTGSLNTVIGYGALPLFYAGTNNIAIGTDSGFYFGSGNDNIYIGSIYGSFPDYYSESQTTRIGVPGDDLSSTPTTRAFIAGITGVAVGGAPVWVNSSGQLGIQGSSRRFKANIQTMADASDVLLSLRPVTFRYKPEIDPAGLPQFGLVAEEVDKVDPDLVLRDAKGEVYTVRYDAVNAMLLNEFQKEHKKVGEQEQKLTAQDTEIQDLKHRLEKLERLVEQQTARR